MKCLKCDKEIENNSKFCNNCGTKVEEQSLSEQLDNTIKTCSRFWYLIGFLRAKDKEALSKVEDILKNSDNFLWEEYKAVIKFWQDYVRDNEKNKKANGS